MVDFKLVVNGNGDIEVIKKAGSAFVKTAYPVGKCEGLIATAKSVESSDRFPGYAICINGGEFYFAGTFKADKEAEEKPTKKTTSKKK